MLNQASDRWIQITPARFNHEKTGYDLLAGVLADREPHRVWANFDFEGPDGAFHHVDALVVTGVGVFAIDFVDVTGKITGDQQAWRVTAADGRTYTRPNPGPAVRMKAAALTEALAAMHPEQVTTPLMGLAVVIDEVFLPRGLNVRRSVVATTGEVTLSSALQEGRFPGASDAERYVPNATVAEQLAQAMRDGREADVVRRADHYRRAGDWRLEELLFSSPTFQDFRGRHMSDARQTRRVRRFNVAGRFDELKKRKIERAARREYGLLASLDHPGVARVIDFRATEFGPCLFFDDLPDAIRLDAFLADRGAGLSFETRTQLFDQLVEAVRYMHGKGIVHRALAPNAVLVTNPGSDQPRLQVFDWQTGDRPEGTSRGTQHVQQLLDAEAQAFIAPEVAVGLPGDEAADVFSLGLLACTLFAGRAPQSRAELDAHLAEHHGLRLSAFADGMPRGLEEVVFAATRGDVGQRIQDVDALAEQVDKALAYTTTGHEVIDPTRARPGTQLGPFTVERTLGTGGSAVALLVEDEAGRKVVLKIPRTLDDERRIREEAAVLRRLDHPSIVKCHDVVELADRPVLVVDYAGDKTLRDRLRQEVLGEEVLENAGRDLLDALDHILARGELHRDIKPANMSLDTGAQKGRLRLKLFDFSLAGVERTRLEVGTTPYRDPFLGRDGRMTWDAHAEMYAAALVMHEMATGVRPVWGDGRSAADQIEDDCPDIKPEQFDPGAREGLAGFFRRALHRDTKKRFADIDEMRHGWRRAFSESSGHTVHPSTETVDVDTPVGHLGLSPRAVNTLDRLNVPTVADLLRVSDHILRFLPGVGAATRRELRDKRTELEHLRAAAEAVDRPPPEIGRLVEVLEDFLDVFQRGRQQAAEARVRYLGLVPLTEGEPPGTWPTATDVGQALETTRANVSAHLAKDREVWSDAPAVSRLRDDLERLLDDAGGVMTPRQLAERLLGLWVTNATDEDERLRLACAVARLGVETEMARDEPRFSLFRDREGQVLVASEHDRVVWARTLGRAADEMADRDPLSAPGRVAAELRKIAGDDGLPTARLLRMAAAFSRHAAVSSWQELYPRGMAAERALSLARNAVLTPGTRNQLADVAPDDLRSRVHARYPEAQPLPDRPALDALVERAGLPLWWNPQIGMYAPERVPGLQTRGGSSLTQYTQTTRPPAARPAPDLPAPDVRTFDARLRDAREPGAWCVFTVPTNALSRARRLIEQRCDPIVRSLDRMLLDHLDAVAAEKRIKWKLLLHADRSAPTSRDGQKLRLVVERKHEGSYGTHASSLIVTKCGGTC